MNRTETNAYPNLDLMRACAVLFVLAFHLLLYFQVEFSGPFKLTSIGHWGVLIFFVHTCFVLNLALERQAIRSSGVRLLWTFLVQRIARILPLSLLVVFVVVYLHLPVGHLKNGIFRAVKIDTEVLVSNIFLIQNITHTESVMAPLWSLPYEMQMYLLLPALFVLARSFCSLLPLVVIWGLGLIAASRPWYFEEHGVPDLVAYLPYFLPGVIAYKLMARQKFRLPAILWPLTLAGVTMLYIQVPSNVRGAVCCLLLGLAIPYFRQISHPVVNRISQTIARYSYGIYLVHFICIWFAFQYLAELARSTQWLIFGVAVVVVPVALYHTVEEPMIRLGRRLTSAPRTSACPVQP